MPDPYYTSSPAASGEEETFDVSMDALTVGRLKRYPTTGDWVLSSGAPLFFEDVSIPGDYDERRARSSAEGWVEHHVANERPDLLEDD